MNNKSIRFLFYTGLSLLILAVSGVLIFTGVIDEYTAQILTLAGINTIIALSLNLISGYTGQLALGHAGFMAIGGYTTAILIMKTNYTVLQQNQSFWGICIWFGLIAGAVLIGGFVTAIFGLAIGFPTLRLKGDYLAIVTLGFGEIIRVLMINMEGLTGGAAGLKGIPQFSEDFTWGPMISFLWITVFMILTIFLVSNLIKSSHGRAIVSIREDEIAANSMGVNAFYYKMFSFTLSAFIAGIGGGLYALFFGYMNPTMFNFLKSLDFLVYVVLGGMGSILGTVVTGYILTYLQEFLRVLQDYRLVFYPLILIIIMLFKPTGLIGIMEDIKNWLKKSLNKRNESRKSGVSK